MERTEFSAVAAHAECKCKSAIRIEDKHSFNWRRHVLGQGARAWYLILIFENGLSFIPDVPVDLTGSLSNESWSEGPWSAHDSDGTRGSRTVIASSMAILVLPTK